MNIFLTGATGLLGSHILHSGLKQGYNFILPYRKISKRSYLSTQKENSNLRLIEYNFDNSLEVFDFSNIDIVINCAALLSPFEKDHESMQKINTDFVKKLYLHSAKNNIKFFYQVSSNSVFGTEKQNSIITEEDNQYCRQTFYTKTKKESDIWLNKQTQIPHAIIHPAYMLDDFDSKPSSGALLIALKMKKFQVYSEGIKNIVSASDVADGIFKLINSQKKGSYILGGENIKISDFLRLACELQGKSFEDLREVSREELLSHPIEREFCLTQGLSSNKAIESFRYQINDSPEECLQKALNWFKEKKILRF